MFLSLSLARRIGSRELHTVLFREEMAMTTTTLILVTLRTTPKTTFLSKETAELTLDWRELLELLAPVLA